MIHKPHTWTFLACGGIRTAGGEMGLVQPSSLPPSKTARSEPSSPANDKIGTCFYVERESIAREA